MKTLIRPASIARLILIVVAALTACGHGPLWTESLEQLERPPRAKELFAYPADQKEARVNPPGFTWTPNDDAKSYRLEVARSDDPGSLVLSESDLASTVFAPGELLDPGEYAWQVVYVGPGQASTAPKDIGVSKTRTFKLSADAPPLPMPDMDALEAKLSPRRPRLFIDGNRLDEIRQAVKAGEVPWWPFFIAAADLALEEELYPEPEGYPNGEWDVEHWRRIYRPAKIGTTHLTRLALAYKLTGEKKYLDGAKRWMMNFASWAPDGVVSHDVPQPDGSEGNDEGSMPILERMAFAWDWIGEELTPAEKQKVLAVMTERGDQVLRLLKKQDFYTHPFENHEGRVLAFLGNAGLSFLGDIPAAKDWLGYVLRCYLTSFPGWGSDPGGWAQGLGYWSGYVTFLSTFAESLRGATDTDILRRPFYRNTGYLPLYFHPPYAPRGAFGDDSGGKPSDRERILVDFFAEVYEDPYLKWQAVHQAEAPPKSPVDPSGSERWNEWAMEDVLSVLRAGRSQTEPKPPTDLDGSRLWDDIGWAAMHSSLGDADNDVWMLFKSSRYGSFSHSHADQNSFQLSAYGEALAIDSGYYPYYGSPHHALWTRQTRAHNSILVHRRGQPPFSWDAGGEIESYQSSGRVTIVRGQAAKGYNVPMRDGVLEDWKKHLTEAVPSMEPKVENFQRTVAFVASTTRPIAVVYDQVRTSGATTFDWLLHALDRIDIKKGGFTIRRGKARAAVRLLATQPFKVSQTDRFSVPPGNRYEGAAKQWHLTASSTEPTEEIKFLAVLVPYREGEPEPRIEILQEGDSVGFQIGNTSIAAWWGEGPVGPIKVKEISGQGRLIVETGEGSARQTATDK